MSARSTQLDYVAAGAERELALAACAQRTPVLLLGPTGCGKTRLVESVARQLGRPLLTVSCHDDMTTADLVGRQLLRGGDVAWSDGPLTTAMRTGAVCYLDEVVEARADTLAVLHSVADHRRTLYLERTGEALAAAEGFQLVASYNPRPAGSPKQLKPALSQRFATIRIDYLPAEAETAVVTRTTGAADATAAELVSVARALRDAAAERPGRFEPPSTRALINAAGLVVAGAPRDAAIETCVLGPLVADAETLAGLRAIAAAAVEPVSSSSL